ncbi:cupin domain-containing protein [Pseudoxanthomonas sp.]|uniref:cupin domain-containing protein n=1 Tax=Pseudoxanthomonas sp. TaxID=1871049 RepID=UPI0026334E0B|nr:cupin domain-containing protein [Pseudoxanthomonas sp.]WDS34830.1 MAG: cupin domain-containing protein [Pseudoxanthomonas sp.]
MARPTLSAALASALALACVPALAEVHARQDLQVIDKPHLGGGTGTVHGQFAFTRDKAPADHALREISWLTIAPGDSIGTHTHAKDEDAYVIVSGTGTFTDADGKQVPVKAGDITVVYEGQSHGLVNIGTEPLVLVDVLAAK